MQGSKLYVGNLNYAVTSEELQGLFEQHGTIKDLKLIEGKGFGFIEMETQEQAIAAMEALNGQDFKGRSLRIDEARPPKKRDGGFRRY